MVPQQNQGRVYLLILFALMFFSVRAAFGAVEEKPLEFLSKAKLTEFNKQFNESSSTKIDQNKIEKEWVCDMYGVRSRFQAEHGIHLYAFKAAKDSKDLENSGAHIFKSYKMSEAKTELVGEKNALKETIRWTKKGELLSKLETSSNTLVAFSTCKPL